ncbi:hypothetical protein [Flavobacterium sp. H122]|uniref:hypothetical protein n=1 Tax=Flavobacterium sp. H122 TaxID=2529860 RepID=UPI0010A9F38C|nr:hypothetical protein [Flavobacterium sp. H122]
MLKNILNLEGTKKLTNKEQKEINGGALTFPSYCNWQICADPNYLNDPYFRKCKDYCDAI